MRDPPILQKNCFNLDILALWRDWCNQLKLHPSTYQNTLFCASYALSSSRFLTDGDISGTKRAIRVPLVSKRPELRCHFRFEIQEQILRHLTNLSYSAFSY